MNIIKNSIRSGSLRRKKEMATHSSILAWRIPGTEKPAGCSPWGRTELDTTEATSQQQQQNRLINASFGHSNNNELSQLLCVYCVLGTMPSPLYVLSHFILITTL